MIVLITLRETADTYSNVSMDWSTLILACFKSLKFSNFVDSCFSGH